MTHISPWISIFKVCSSVGPKTSLCQIIAKTILHAEFRTFGKYSQQKLSELNSLATLLAEIRL